MYTDGQHNYGATPLVFLLPLPIPRCFNPTSLLLTVLGNPPWCDRIPSTLVLGCSYTDLPLSIPSPFPSYPKFPTPWGSLELNMRLTKTTSRIRLSWSGTLPVVLFSTVVIVIFSVAVQSEYTYVLYCT
jgi:hypothetical protein